MAFEDVRAQTSQASSRVAPRVLGGHHLRNSSPFGSRRQEPVSLLDEVPAVDLTQHETRLSRRLGSERAHVLSFAREESESVLGVTARHEDVSQRVRHDLLGERQIDIPREGNYPAEGGERIGLERTPVSGGDVAGISFHRRPTRVGVLHDGRRRPDAVEGEHLVCEAPRGFRVEEVEIRELPASVLNRRLEPASAGVGVRGASAHIRATQRPVSSAPLVGVLTVPKFLCALERKMDRPGQRISAVAGRGLCGASSRTS